ncbi:dohh [Scenedesmus sp. PABB004]|nr:dohh [Scenedesmus sp. PABB004]
MATLVQAPDATVEALGCKLRAPGTSLPDKYRALFSLRNVAGPGATAALTAALQDESDLFRHDVAFCLGQRQDPAAVGVLKQLVADAAQHPMVRHEAAEALGAIADPGCLEVLQRHAGDACQEVAETCQLALGRLAYLEQQKAAPGGGAGGGAEDEQSPYFSVDPTPALPAGTPLEQLRGTLLDAAAPMFERYRALFALRNRGGAEAVAVLGEAFGTSSALLKHEVAYVMGQMQHPASADVLCRVLQDASEHAMVRHEAAEALGAVADAASVALLQRCAADPEPIVAHSCVVALDMLEHERSGAFEYADTAGATAGAAAAEPQRA